jgi:hypothetical protein
LPPGEEREGLLKKARQAETAAHIDDWVRWVCGAPNKFVSASRCIRQSTPAEYKAGLDRAIGRGRKELHESGTYARLTEAGTAIIQDFP